MKLAFIGTGTIVRDALFAVDGAASIQKTAIFGRPHSEEKAWALAERYGIPEVYTNYDELLKRTRADTVYIGLINTAHFDYARRALNSGRHVILEKPFTVSAAQAEELRDLALERRVCLFEAITVTHNDVMPLMKANLPKLGTIRMAHLNYSQYSSRYDAYLQGRVAHAFDPVKAGGALYDIDVYNIHYCISLFGPPTQVTYHPNLGFNGVDTSGTLVMNYPGFTAVLTGAKDSDSPCFVQIQGEKGYMKIDGKPNAPANLTTVYVDSGEAGPQRDASGATVRPIVTEVYEAPPVRHRMTREFLDFAEIIDGHRPDGDQAWAEWMEETIEVVRVLEIARNGGRFKCKM